MNHFLLMTARKPYASFTCKSLKKEMQARKRSEVVCSVVLMAWGAALARALHGTAVGKPLVCGCPSCAKNGDEGVAVAAHMQER